MNLQLLSRASGLGLCLALAACGGGGGTPINQTPDVDFGLGLNGGANNNTGNLSNSFGANFGSAFSDRRSLLPPIGDQGSQGSCVGWATGYYVKTAMEARASGWNTSARERQFSPSWIYNQINNGVDQGSQPSDALNLLQQRGAATLATMPYDVGNFTDQPSATAIAEAERYRNASGDEFTFNPQGMADYLASEGPLVLGIQVLRNFYDAGTDYTEASGDNLGGHAIACVGYDPDRNGGSFLLANSWGTQWGDAGYTYVPTNVLQQIFLGAWTMTDGPNQDDGGGVEDGDLVAPSVTANVFGTVVELKWTPVSIAHAYRIEFPDPKGDQLIASFDLDATSTSYTFIDLEPNKSYTFGVAALDASGTSSDFTRTTVTTGATEDGGDPDPSNDPFGLRASNPQSGEAFPARVRLSWTAFQGDLVYTVLRAFENTEQVDQNSLQGYNGDQFQVVGQGIGLAEFDDFEVEAGASYVYWVLASNRLTESTVGSSQLVRGATAGFAGGLDLAILDARAEFFLINPGQTVQGEMLIGNLSGTASEAQVLWTGVEYYDWISDAYGVYWFQDGGETPVFAGFTGAELPAGEAAGYATNPTVPFFVDTNMNTTWNAWIYWVDGVNAEGTELVEEIDLGNNVFYDSELIFFGF